MNQEPGTPIEVAIILNEVEDVNEVEDQLKKLTGLNIVLLMELPNCEKSEIKWLSPVGVESDDCRVVKTLEIYGFKTVWMATRKSTGIDNWDVFWNIVDYQFQIWPEDPRDAIFVESESRIEDAVQQGLYDASLYMPPYEKFHEWIASSKALNGWRNLT